MDKNNFPKGAHFAKLNPNLTFIELFYRYEKVQYNDKTEALVLQFYSSFGNWMGSFQCDVSNLLQVSEAEEYFKENLSPDFIRKKLITAPSMVPLNVNIESRDSILRDISRIVEKIFNYKPKCPECLIVRTLCPLQLRSTDNGFALVPNIKT